MRLTFRALALCVGLSCGVLGAQAQNAPPPPRPAPISKIVVPAETTIPLQLRNAITSRTAYVGQTIYCETIFPITAGNRIVIPAGSYVKGSVAQVVRPGRIKGRAQIGLRFDSLVLQNGTTKPLRATLSASTGNGRQRFNRTESKIEGEGSKGEDAEKVAITTVAGERAGEIVGITHGALGKGVAIGSGAGAAGGLIWVLASRGRDIYLPSGTDLELQLTAPLTFDFDDVDPPSRYDQGPALPRREPDNGF